MNRAGLALLGVVALLVVACFAGLILVAHGVNTALLDRDARDDHQADRLAQLEHRKPSPDRKGEGHTRPRPGRPGPTGPPGPPGAAVTPGPTTKTPSGPRRPRPTRPTATPTPRPPQPPPPPSPRPPLICLPIIGCP